MNPSPKKWSRLALVLFQVLLWAVFYLLLLLYTSHKWDNPVYGFANATITTLSYLLACYVHGLLLLPLFLYKGRSVLYVALSFFFLAILIGARMWVEHQVLLPLHTKFYAYTWAHFSFTCITVLVAFLFGALLKVLLNYLQLLQVKAALQQQHSEAELNLLKAQVQPHFLFNTLNNIYSLALSRSDKTPETIAMLSELMRYFIDEAPKQRVPVATEIQFIKTYVALEQIRMLHPVAVSWEIDSSCVDPSIPPMLLMPFVENVFKHGVDKLKRENFMKLQLKMNDQQLQFQVCNSVSEIKQERGGSGLNNLRRRLELLYGNRYRMHISNGDELYSAELIIPLHD